MPWDDLKRTLGEKVDEAERDPFLGLPVRAAKGAIGAGEAGLSMATAIPSYLGAQLTGGIDILRGKNPGDVLRDIPERTASTTYQPQTRAGKDITQGAGEVMGSVFEPVGEAISHYALDRPEASRPSAPTGDARKDAAVQRLWGIRNGMGDFSREWAAPMAMGVLKTLVDLPAGHPTLAGVRGVRAAAGATKAAEASALSRLVATLGREGEAPSVSAALTKRAAKMGVELPPVLGTPERAAWEAQYAQRMAAHPDIGLNAGETLVPAKVPLASLEPGHHVSPNAKSKLYADLESVQRPRGPLIVYQTETGELVVKDGNHGLLAKAGQGPETPTDVLIIKGKKKLKPVNYTVETPDGDVIRRTSPIHTGDLAEQAYKNLTEKGGFTIGPEGVRPRKGYAVATRPDLGRKYVSGQEFTPADLRRYFYDVRKALAENPRLGLGGWKDTSTGNIWLDVPSVAEKAKEAQGLGFTAREKAAFNLGPKGGDLPIEYSEAMTPSQLYAPRGEELRPPVPPPQPPGANPDFPVYAQGKAVGGEAPRGTVKRQQNPQDYPTMEASGLRPEERAEVDLGSLDRSRQTEDLIQATSGLEPAFRMRALERALGAEEAPPAPAVVLPKRSDVRPPKLTQLERWFREHGRQGETGNPLTGAQELENLQALQLHVQPKKGGGFVGAPENIRTLEDLERQRAQLTGQALEGAKQNPWWYEVEGGARRAMNPRYADEGAYTSGIYSPQASPGMEKTRDVESRIARAGQGPNAPKKTVPLFETQARNAYDIMEGVPPEKVGGLGEKTGTYASNQLLAGGKEPGTAPYMDPTIDTHMATAVGHEAPTGSGQLTLSPGEHAWGKGELMAVTDRIMKDPDLLAQWRAETGGIDPQNQAVQAAIWFEEKSRKVAAQEGVPIEHARDLVRADPASSWRKTADYMKAEVPNLDPAWLRKTPSGTVNRVYEDLGMLQLPQEVAVTTPESFRGTPGSPESAYPLVAPAELYNPRSTRLAAHSNLSLEQQKLAKGGKVTSKPGGKLKVKGGRAFTEGEHIKAGANDQGATMDASVKLLRYLQGQEGGGWTFRGVEHPVEMPKSGGGAQTQDLLRTLSEHPGIERALASPDTFEPLGRMADTDLFPGPPEGLLLARDILRKGGLPALREFVRKNGAAALPGLLPLLMQDEGGSQ